VFSIASAATDVGLDVGLDGAGVGSRERTRDRCAVFEGREYGEGQRRDSVVRIDDSVVRTVPSDRVMDSAVVEAAAVILEWWGRGRR
jgi:hypothetical protein